MQISIDELRRIVREILIKYGYHEGEVGIIRDVLLYAQLREKEHGVVKLLDDAMKKSERADEITTIKETKLSASIDGNFNSGMVVMDKAMRVALQKAREHGFGIVGTFNTFTSTGALGYYAREIAEKGFIGFVFSGSNETVAPHGGYEPIYGTNPIATGVPSEEGPIVMDMGTSEISWHALLAKNSRGESLPPHSAYDVNGNPTTAPTLAMQGALRSFGGQKGSALSFMIEVLTGPLVNASFTGIGDTSHNWGNLVFVIDPELLTDSANFAKNVTLMKERVKSTRANHGVTEIFVPGERSDRIADEHLASGQMEIEEELLRSLKKIIGEKLES